MQTVTLARNAMATRFEMVLHGENASRLRAAGEEAFAEIERLEAQLSIFRPTSEIARVNAGASRQPVRVTPSVFRLLCEARQMNAETGGAFDITIAPLVKCWGFMNGSGAMPDPAEIERVRQLIGMHHVCLDENNFTVQFDRDSVMLDLGAIGKGYAIDRAAATLREAGVTDALLHGGTSTVCGLGHPPGQETWKVAIDSPPQTAAATAWIATVPLRDEAMSVSAVWGKSFEHAGVTFGHILDPRLGRPAGTAVLAAVVLPSATQTDALSTALLVAGAAGHEEIFRLRPGIRTLLAEGATADFQAQTRGIEIRRRETIEIRRENG